MCARSVVCIPSPRPVTEWVSFMWHLNWSLVCTHTHTKTPLHCSNDFASLQEASSPLSMVKLTWTYSEAFIFHVDASFHRKEDGDFSPKWAGHYAAFKQEWSRAPCICCDVMWWKTCAVCTLDSAGWVLRKGETIGHLHNSGPAPFRRFSMKYASQFFFSFSIFLSFIESTIAVEDKTLQSLTFFSSVTKINSFLYNTVSLWERERKKKC